jgi:hypothetical protein
MGYTITSSALVGAILAAYLFLPQGLEAQIYAVRDVVWTYTTGC